MVQVKSVMLHSSATAAIRELPGCFVSFIPHAHIIHSAKAQRKKPVRHNVLIRNNNKVKSRRKRKEKKRKYFFSEPRYPDYRDPGYDSDIVLYDSTVTTRPCLSLKKIKKSHIIHYGTVCAPHVKRPERRKTFHSIQYGM